MANDMPAGGTGRVGRRQNTSTGVEAVGNMLTRSDRTFCIAAHLSVYRGATRSVSFTSAAAGAGSWGRTWLSERKVS
jgi:hypothetical protein